VLALLADLPGQWWIAGGWAIDLFAGKPWREHSDVDVLVLRKDLAALHDAMPGWELFACQYPGADQLRLWEAGETLPDVVHDIWCRPRFGAPWAMQFMVMDHDETADRWIYRRDRRVGGSVADMTVLADGYPVLAPEIQLLFKSKAPRAKDTRDAERALPLLAPERKQRLIDALTISDPENPWIGSLRNHSVRSTP
jgi:hypothetical protein